MLKLHWALLVALVMLVGWLAWLGYASDWYLPEFYERLAVSALSWRLVGLGGLCLTEAVDAYRAELAAAESAGDDVWQQTARGNVMRLRIELARLLLAEGHPDAALRLAEEAHRADYEDAHAAAFLWQVRHAANSPSEARKELLLLAMERPLPETLIALGEVALADGNMEDALYYASRARETAETNPELWYLLARVHLADSQHTEDARDAAARAVSLSQDRHVLAHHSRRVCLDIDVAKAQNGGRQGEAVWLEVRAWLHDHWAFLAIAGGFVIVLASPGLIGLVRRNRNEPHGCERSDDEPSAPGADDTE